MAEDATGEKTRRRKIIVWMAIVLALTAAVGLGIWGWYRWKIWPAETARLLEARNLALGYLENEEFDKCNPLFDQLAKDLPKELFAARNLAIARVLTVRGIGPTLEPERFAEAARDAQAALDHLQNVEGQSAEFYLLAGRLAGYLDDEEAAIEAYAEAARLAPKNPAAWGELFLAARASQDPVRQSQAREALEQAYALAPGNLFLLLEMLSQQVAQRDEAVAETLAHARKVVAPFAEAIERRQRIDILELIDKALAALEPDDQPPDWTKVKLNVAYLTNLMRPENAHQRDLSRIEQYELEYLIDDFSPAFYETHYLPEIDAPPAIAVRFVKQETPAAWQDLAAVKDVQLADFDLDGRWDLVVALDAEVIVFGQTDAGWKPLASLEVPPGTRGVIAADLDRDFREAPTRFRKTEESEEDADVQPGLCLDADPDILVFGASGLTVLKNNLDPDSNQRSLEVVDQSEEFAELAEIYTAVFVDLDQDGDLDIAASGQQGISLWLNLDNKLQPIGFVNVTSRSDLPPAEAGFTTMIAVDWDRNVAVDLVLVGGGSASAGWLENLHHGRFRWQAFNDSFSQMTAAKTAALIDADGNASWDLITSSEKGLTLGLTKTPDTAVIRFQQEKSIHQLQAAGILPFDYDNDGIMDFLTWSKDGETLFHGRLDESFSPENLFDALPPMSAGAVAGDLDRDGDLDLLFFGPDGMTLYDNDGGNQNRWINVALRADQNPQFPAERCNMAGIGSLLEIKAGQRYQAAMVNRSVTHFGLGQLETPDLLRVLWTNGIPENVLQPETNTLICDEQRLKGSCPYLYTWDGERFVFHTDLLWAAPVGLQFAEHQLAPAREWEYLLIEGDKLKPKEGQYHLQITEELWEAAYFDQVELIAIDHPPGTRLFSNEKVGPAAIAEPTYYLADDLKLPKSAKDQAGRDVLKTLATPDDYVQAYNRRVKQGLTEEHFLELDLGELKDAESVTLFLRGWVFPTDTSLNVGIGQNPDVHPPRPPALSVPDENGQWREAIPYIGFPGGKTKTIAVEVPTSLFKHDDYRVRITSSMQINWDQIHFSTTAKSFPIEQKPLELLSADLHFRGYSQIVGHDRNGPDIYDYNSVSKSPIWPPMMGRFTKFGDVAELIRKTDDRLVVMGAGDEMTLKFQAPPPPPAGWTRSFLLHNVGWDKDADLNTVHGETVEPLPFAGMKQYPYEPEQSSPKTREYLEYLKTYQTREQSHRQFWNHVRNAK